MTGAEALIIGSAGLSTLGAVQQASAASASAKSQAQASEYNAQVQQQQAQTALQQASMDEEAQRRKSAQQLGNLRGQLIENGATTSTGLFEQSARNAELDALNIRYGGVMNAKSYNEAAGLFKRDATQQKANAKTATQSGFINAGASILGGATKLNDYRANKKLIK